MEEKIAFIIGIIMFSSFILLFFGLAAGLFLATFRNIRAAIRGKLSSMEPCRSCGNSVSKTAVICPYCGDNFGQINVVANSIIGSFISGVVSVAGGLLLILGFMEFLRDW
ncbi:hypothetical protein C161_27228 [Paenibacillus sp. FSL R5-192]|uniref:hypothetical protein n=1 Tax=Paenibacillus sp. FSL R5-192 TaxID=1226754 RepID=UPI0003E2258F|nr:hypothetical protein [Paenibacillus sp. FSL R5-192]ETT30668.1 hypothetical protein C161_27228 [Paenibacillus sp. FSL R5-192]